MYKQRPRVIPVMLLQGDGFVKTRRFSNPVYLGDPINTIKLFNDKEVDEIVVLDIEATRFAKKPNFEKIKEIASECFMPLGYGGGVQDASTVARLLCIGIEKIIVNSVAFESPGTVVDLVKQFGSSTIVGSIDANTNWLGKRTVCIHAGSRKIPHSLTKWAMMLEDMGVGEILVNAIDRDGELVGYDIDMIKEVAGCVSVPVIACGGARGVSDFSEAINAGASAAAAGAAFVFKGKHRAVLIQYPTEDEIRKAFE